MPCTTILVGKDATYDGSTFAARIEDSVEGIFRPKKFAVIPERENPGLYRAVISHAEIELPEKALRMTSMPNADPKDGVWGACGVNSLNVAMTATETITSNERVLGADPLVELVPAHDGEPEIPGGIGEEDMLDLVLPYIRSAREGVRRLGALLERYGTYEMNGIAFQDVEEVWWLETIGGHHWIARRVPDDAYAVIPNQLGIDGLDLADALGEQKDAMCSADLRSFIEKNFLAADADGLNARQAFGSLRDADHLYNTPRAWTVQRFFNPHGTDLGPESDELPWCMRPERKITVEDMKYILSSHYQGTKYDPYLRSGDKSSCGMYRPIGINRSGFMALTQIRPYSSETHRAIEWVAFGSNPFNAFVPLYVNIDHAPAYLTNTDATVTTENFYWANRLIGAMADASFEKCEPHITRYRLTLQSKARAILNRYDVLLEECAAEKAVSLCEEANDEIVRMAKAETYAVLDHVLRERSLQMRNRFDRSDS